MANGEVSSKRTSSGLSNEESDETGSGISSTAALTNFSAADRVLLLFTTYSCDSCNAVKEYFDILLEKSGESGYEDLKIIELNILEN